MALTTSLSARITTTHTGTAPTIDLGSGAAAQVAIDKQLLVNLATGTAAGQADRQWSDQRTIAASANDDLDLAGSLTDPFGNTITFARIKGIYIAAASGNTNNVLVGAAASNQFSTFLNAAGTATLRPGAFLLAVAGSADATGWAVTAATGDLLRIANSSSGSSVTYEIIVIGASA